MKSTIVMLALAFAAGNVLAADPVKKATSPAQQAQQEKMRACNGEAKAKALKGSERKTFMSGCLKTAKK